MANKAHIVYLNQSGVQIALDALKYLGTVPNDTARDAISPVFYGNTVVVSNSVQAGGGPAFYHYNGSIWELIGGATITTQILNYIANSYTKIEVDNLFLSHGLHPPVDTQGDLPAITPVAEGDTVVVKDDGDGKPAYYIYNGATWVKVADPDIITDVMQLLIDVADHETRLQEVEYWQSPKATLVALNAVPAPQNGETRIVFSDSENAGNPTIRRYNSSAAAWQLIATMPVAADLATLDTYKVALQAQGVDNLIYYALAENAIYRYDFTSDTWVAIAGGTGVGTYTNPLPTPSTLGGIPAGSTFNAVSFEDMFDMLLYPFQYPAFTFFGITGQNTTIEVGDSISSGNKTFTWGTTNPSNISPNTIEIKDFTNNTVLVTGSANDGTEVINFPSAITKVISDTHNWTIKGTNTQSGTFSASYAVNWRFRKFTGTSVNATLVEADIEALVTQSLSNTFAGTYSFSAGGYKYFAFPNSWGSPASFKDTATQLAVAMADASDGYALSANGINYAIVSVTNAFGVTENYRVYRSKNVLGGAINIIVS